MKPSLVLAPMLALTLALGALPGLAAPELSQEDTQELDQSYQLMTNEFYKQVDAQVLLDGARTEMIDILKKGGVASPDVTVMKSTGDPTQNMHELDREVQATIAKYGGKVPKKDITWAAIAGMLASVKDKYTVFLSPKEYASLNAGLEGENFSGVGISIRVDETTKDLTVIDVIPDGPAEKAGIQSGDIISAIDGKPTKGQTSEEDSKQLRGPKDTVVKLTVERGGAPLPSAVAVTRAVIHSPSVYARMLPDNIGYARLTVFGATTGSELTSALAKLEAQGAKAYVLDLRDNGGGYLNAAIEVSSKFISSGPIVSVESRGGSNAEYDADNTAVPPLPLAVLVNRYTASASEITSGAIQDSGVGELIGERTFGKGVVQTIHQLPDGSAIKITSARYLTPHGRDINLIGIQPDVATTEPKTARIGDPANDAQLQAALTYLKGKIAAAN